MIGSRGLYTASICLLLGMWLAPQAWAKEPKPRTTKKMQLLQGRVLVRGQREPIPGAGVFVRALKRGTYADATGRYQLRLPAGKHKLIIKAIGFLSLKQTITITPGKAPVAQNLFLLEDPANPLQSTVRAKRKKKSSQQFSASREMMQAAPGLLGGDPFRFFQNLPGVARAARVSGAIVVRGASLADSSFMIDGHRIPYLYHFGAGLTVISRRFMEKIDFYPGGAPLRYGRLTAGLLDAQSRMPKSTTVHGEIYISIANAGFYLEIPLGKRWSIAAAASRSYIDAFYSLITKDALVGGFWDYQLKISYRTRRHQFSLFFLGSDDYYDYAGKNDGPEVPLIGRAKVTKALRFLRMIAKYSYVTPRFSLRTSLAAGFDQEQNETIARKDNALAFPIEVRLDATWKLHKTLQLSVGFDGLWKLQNNDFQAPENEAGSFPRPGSGSFQLLNQSSQQLLSPAAYISLRWQPIDRLVLHAGTRSDINLYGGNLQTTVDPRLSGTFKLHKNLKLLLSAGIYHRPPAEFERSSTRGNPSLELPGAYQVATGLSFAYQRLIQLRTQFFYTHMFNQVVSSEALVNREGTLGPERYNNDGNGRAFGMEMLLRFQLAKRLFGWVAYTLSRAERGRNDGPSTLFAFDQTHILNVMLRWRIGAGWSMSARFRMSSGNPVPTLERVVYDADTDNYRPIFSASQDQRLPLFHQLDLRVDKVWTFNNWKLGFYLDILNVYNANVAEEYRYSYDFKTREPVRGLPFFPALGLRGEF